MKRAVRCGIIGLLAVFALSLLACSGGGGGGGGGTATYSLSVSGTPADARVYLNGQRVENPQRITLPPGTHRIRVEITLSDGQVVFQEFEVVAGSTSSIQYDLRRYRIELSPSTIETRERARILVSATLRDLNTGNPVEAQLEWSTTDPAVAAVEQVNRTSAHIVGVRAGATRLIVKDTQTNTAIEAPVSVVPNPFTIVSNPARVEVWVDEQVTVTATLRDGQGASVNADFEWAVRDARIASVQKLNSTTARVRGVSRGSTRLVITDRLTGTTLEVPVSVLDFPPPPN